MQCNKELKHNYFFFNVDLFLSPDHIALHATTKTMIIDESRTSNSDFYVYTILKSMDILSILYNIT